MKTNRATLMLTLAFVMTLTAGIIVGRLFSNRATTQAPPAPHAGSSLLVNELQLSDDQLKRMRPIWEETRETVQDCISEAQRLHQQQDEQLTALLTPAQRTEYARISTAARERLAALDAKRRDVFATAVTKSRELLRPDQWNVYQQILKNQVGSVPGAEPATSTTRP